MDARLCGGQEGAFAAGKIESITNEFREGMIFGRIGEKYRKAVAERDGHDEFGREDVGSDRTQPGAEALPYRCGAVEGEGLQHTLGDDL
jgi:hypothetical protein